MQLESNDLRAAKRILAKLVDDALLEYERNLADLDLEALLNHLFLQLKSLLGDILVEALSILDEQSIQIYTYENSELAEIQIRRQQCKSSIWLFPRVNYCTCTQFKVGVLGLPDELQPASQTSHSEKLERIITCAHVLALRLAQLLHPSPSTFKVESVSEQQFKSLQERMHSSFIEIHEDSTD
ncbi:PREDICTED: uncharacterized protein LOC108382732 isoform X2 [Rhagoletis zephyria]|uniref:uncharacterized protein LOC108382732 isoform X2 n=1 Tax=Rhagoletis zephyria TaxID=28612 RepID=UPI00081171CC|nr:PREDICTED: uncharacterized protein LOC108382732 isoform X2 [Rhagoletis zephyria]